MADAPDAGGEDRGRPILIGLTGGVGAGKSTVARLFENEGCARFDADASARAALDREDVRRELRAWWGDDVIEESGAVDRAAVARIVFADDDQRRRLERLVHPMVREDLDRAIAEAARAGEPALVADVPLLVEGGLAERCDAVVFVDAPREVRLGRARRERGWTEAEFERREKSQAPLEKKRRLAHYVVDNTSGESGLPSQVREILQRILPQPG